MSVVNVVFCQVEVCASSRSLVQRNTTDCGASNERDLETPRMRRPWPALGCSATGNKTEVYTSCGFLKRSWKLLGIHGRQRTETHNVFLSSAHVSRRQGRK
jgi:hypothetical protein